jgi:hypothetical protein
MKEHSTNDLKPKEDKLWKSEGNYLDSVYVQKPTVANEIQLKLAGTVVIVDEPI